MDKAAKITYLITANFYQRKRSAFAHDYRHKLDKVISLLFFHLYLYHPWWYLDIYISTMIVYTIGFFPPNQITKFTFGMSVRTFFLLRRLSKKC